MKSYDVVGYAADADVWCEDCLIKAGYSTSGRDSEGNDVYPVFAGEMEEGECCGACGGPLAG